MHLEAEVQHWGAMSAGAFLVTSEPNGGHQGGGGGGGGKGRFYINL